MIQINNNQVLITAGNTHLTQSAHPETRQPFQSEADCFAWVQSSGWFDRCKTEAINQLKAQATVQINAQVPQFKQMNAALGMYSYKQRSAITSTIKSIRSKVDILEQSITNAKTLSEFQNLLTQVNTLNGSTKIRQLRQNQAQSASAAQPASAQTTVLQTTAQPATSKKTAKKWVKKIFSL